MYTFLSDKASNLDLTCNASVAQGNLGIPNSAFMQKSILYTHVGFWRVHQSITK